jgi:hypothetical protein
MRPTYLLFVLLTSLITSTALSQNILTSTIEWNSSSTFAALEGIITDENTRVVTSPTTITWYDSQNVVKKTFDITEVEGSWTNIFSNGSILFNVTSGNFSGIAQFIKTNDVKRIRFHLVHEDESVIYDLTFTDVNVL